MVHDILELLKELVRRPSITPEDHGCQDLVAGRLRMAGFEVRRMKFGAVDNLWATHGSGHPVICLAGHTDVVPPGPREKWQSDPFIPTERDGLLYGRGTSDMKASDAAMVVALERIAETSHRGTIALLLTSDEEGSGVDGTRRALQQLMDEGVRIDGAIVGEPTSEREFGDTLKVGRRGSMTGTIVVQGIQGHTAYPHLADNAVHKLAPALADLARLELGGEDHDFPATTLQVCNISAGTGANNVVPGSCELQFNIRFGAGLSSEDIAEVVESVFRSAGIQDEVAWNVSAQPFVTHSAMLIGALEQAIAEETGVLAKRSTSGGTSDARWFAANGIPVAEFGPVNATIHAIDECVDLSVLEPLARIYGAAVSKLLERPAEEHE